MDINSEEYKHNLFTKMCGKDVWISVDGIAEGSGYLADYHYYVRILYYYPENGEIVVNAVNYECAEDFLMERLPSLLTEKAIMETRYVKLAYLTFTNNGYQSVPGVDVLTTDELIEYMKVCVRRGIP